MTHPAPNAARQSIGVMGGTFDPIHHGHLVAASEVMDIFNLDKVIFVPAAMQPFKTGQRVAPAEDRYLMCVVATASNPRFEVSRVDIDRGGTTYTIDTLTDLRAQEPNADYYFITGADALAQIRQWRDSDKLMAMAHFVGVTRPGHTLDPAQLPRDAVSLMEVPAMAISSTDVRLRVGEHRPVWYLVPDGVVQYINKHGLYQNPPAPHHMAAHLPTTAFPGLAQTVHTLTKDTMTDLHRPLIDVIARAASDKLATKPVAVDVGSRLALAEVFVIASAPTDRQVRAIAENIMDEVAKELKERPLRIEGRSEGRWILLDYGDVVVHVLIDEDREYYALERLWGDVPVRQLDPQAVR